MVKRTRQIAIDLRLQVSLPSRHQGYAAVGSGSYSIHCEMLIQIQPTPVIYISSSLKCIFLSTVHGLVQIPFGEG
jgi:hypothetical protein